MMKAQVLPWWLVLVFFGTAPTASFGMETVVLDYSSRNLSAVPSDLPSSAQRLDLSQNLIQTLKGEDFHATPNLRFLNLSWNLIEEIQPDTFTSTPVLATLDLSHNRLRNLSGQEYLRPARSLEYLDLSSNLFMVMELGSEFSTLSNLRWLGLGADAIRNDDFASIADLQLQTLYVQAQNLKVYENGSLTGVRAEKIVVVMSSSSLDFPIIVDALTSFKEVELSGLTNPEDFLGKLLQRQASIQTLNLHLSSIWSTWNQIVLLVNSALMSPIRHLTLTNLTLHQIISLQSVVQNFSLDSFSIRQSSVTVFIFRQELLYNFLINMRVTNATFAESPIIHMTCPASESIIQTLDLSNCVLTERVFSKGPNEECNTLTNLTTLVLKGNNLKHLMPLTSRVRLMSSLRCLDLSHNSLTYREDQGRCTWPRITHLDLSSNSFDQTVFKCLPEAAVNLNLQNNQISAIPANVSGLDSLRVLDLTSNRLLDLPDCLGFPKLQRLVVRGNSLHSPSTDSLQTCPDLKVLDISKNPFICTCPLREFTTLIEVDGTLVGTTAWKNHRITMDHWPNGYRCSYPESWRNTRLQNFTLPAIACSAELLAVTILVPALVLIVSLAILCHRLDLPWYLGMIWKWTRAKHRSRNRSEELQGVCFHAFISYSQRNVDWVKGQLLPKLEGDDSVSTHSRLRVCHHERDFLPGKPIVQNILRCVERSRCCVFVLSSHFIQSEWCHYELYFANHQMLTQGLDNIILILLEPLPSYLIPSKYNQLKTIMARRTYLEWPQDGAKQRMFWANLRAALQADLTNAIEREAD
ncbi:toll-like receptor 1 [Trichomycterus rosablanca]|uniref:toll-like receptor 1 n=1 Tax=Trichomycterus rosablanca TaxID=2290929 RepID=UPI002F360592